MIQSSDVNSRLILSCKRLRSLLQSEGDRKRWGAGGRKKKTLPTYTRCVYSIVLLPAFWNFIGLAFIIYFEMFVALKQKQLLQLSTEGHFDTKCSFVVTKLISCTEQRNNEGSLKLVFL